MVTIHQRNFAGGGGPKKPTLGATETDFDVVFVGKLFVLYQTFQRWCEFNCFVEVPLTWWSQLQDGPHYR